MPNRLMLILLAAVCVVSCGGSSTAPDSAPAGSTTVTIVSGASALSNTAFSPNPISISVGTTVSWLNSDSTTHTSTSDGGAWNSSNLAPGRRFNFTFTTAGAFPYHCTVHPNMIGTINVQ